MCWRQPKLEAWVHEGAAEGEVPLELVRRGEGSFQGSVAAMCCLGVSWRGVGAPRLIQRETRTNAEKYLDVLENTYPMDIASQFGLDPRICLQDGASCCAPHVAQSWCAGNFRAFWPRDAWSPCSPDLSTLDYFVWGWIQGRINEKEPSNHLELKVGIAQASQELPLSILHWAIDSWYARVALCVRTGEMQFLY